MYLTRGTIDIQSLNYSSKPHEIGSTNWKEESSGRHKVLFISKHHLVRGEIVH